MTYISVCNVLCRGLYLGYLKTRSSLAGVKVVVSKQFPNLLPHTKIRDNPHVSKYARSTEILLVITCVTFVSKY